jgi:ElaB/YqjD/DUF883 family membrane-anchored ribosome-binding protein
VKSTFGDLQMTKLDQIKNDIKTLTEDEKQELQKYLSVPKSNLIGLFADSHELVDKAQKKIDDLRKSIRTKPNV